MKAETQLEASQLLAQITGMGISASTRVGNYLGADKPAKVSQRSFWLIMLNVRSRGANASQSDRVRMGDHRAVYVLDGKPGAIL